MFGVFANILLLFAATGVLFYADHNMHWSLFEERFHSQKLTANEVLTWLCVSLGCHICLGFAALSAFRSQYRMHWGALPVGLGAWVIWLLANCVLMFALLVAPTATFFISKQAIVLAGGISWAALNITGAQVFAVARRLSLKPVSEIIREDHENYFVYFRSFASENLPSPDESRIHYFPAAGTFLIPLLVNPTYLVTFRRRSVEEIIVLSGLGSVCPVVAIGQPGEKLPPLGASRAYAADSEWQGLAKSLVEHCRSVFLLPDISEGVIWEFTHLCMETYPAKVMILLPHCLDTMFRMRANGPSAQRTWELFVDACEKRSLPVKLPRTLPDSALVMGFSKDWLPHVWCGSPSIARFKQIAQQGSSKN